LNVGGVVGLNVGPEEGNAVVGRRLGATVGINVGSVVGNADGWKEGSEDG
jgi:hypothetical protein